MTRQFLRPKCLAEQKSWSIRKLLVEIHVIIMKKPTKKTIRKEKKNRRTQLYKKTLKSNNSFWGLSVSYHTKSSVTTTKPRAQNAGWISKHLLWRWVLCVSFRFVTFYFISLFTSYELLMFDKCPTAWSLISQNATGKVNRKKHWRRWKYWWVRDGSKTRN